MLDKEPQSQSLSLWVQETAQWAREFSVSCKEGPPESGGQQGRRSPQSSRAEPLAADAKGDQHGVEHHSGVWSLAVPAVVWRACLSYTLKVLYSTLLGLFDKCLGTPEAKWGFSPGARGGSMAFFLTPLLASGEFPQEPIYG